MSTTDNTNMDALFTSFISSGKGQQIANILQAGLDVEAEKLLIKQSSKDTQEWIETARLVHGYGYIYHLVRYRRDQTKVAIICRMHGMFEQRPNSHLRGHGCPKCGRGAPSDAAKRKNEED